MTRLVGKESFSPLIEYAHVANQEASLVQILSFCVRAWFDKKLVFIKWLDGPIIDKTNMSVADDRIKPLSNSEKIHPSQAKYLGGIHPECRRHHHIFYFPFPPFGLSSAVASRKLFKPINAYIHNKAIRIQGRLLVH